MTKIWIEEIDLSGGQYPVIKNIRYKSLLRCSDQVFLDCSDANIVVKGIVDILH